MIQGDLAHLQIAMQMSGYHWDEIAEIVQVIDSLENKKEPQHATRTVSC